MTEQYADIDGIKICYEILGNEDAYPVFLIHGFGVKKEIWMAQVNELAKYFKVIRFDNRGAGKSDRPDGFSPIETYADDVKKIMNVLKIEKAHIIGWSLGGMIVQNFVLKYPEYVNKVILIATNHGFPNEQGPEIYKKMRLKELELLKEDPMKAFQEVARANFYAKFRKEMEADPKKKFFDIWSAEDFINMSTIDPPRAQDIENFGEALKTHNTFDRLKQIKNETLLIAFSHDRLTPKLSMAEMQEQISNSKLIVIEKAGHFAPMTRAPEVNNAILEFLEIPKELLAEPII